MNHKHYFHQGKQKFYAVGFVNNLASTDAQYYTAEDICPYCKQKFSEVSLTEQLSPLVRKKILSDQQQQKKTRAKRNYTTST